MAEIESVQRTENLPGSWSLGPKPRVVHAIVSFRVKHEHGDSSFNCALSFLEPRTGDENAETLKELTDTGKEQAAVLGMNADTVHIASLSITGYSDYKEGWDD